MHVLRYVLSLVSLVFGEVFFGGSATLHDLFLHFLAKCFFSLYVEENRNPCSQVCLIVTIKFW